ncbi:ABC transporter permease [Aeromicrobium piscarium]|uniref:ABC transporter permease n=1 Tax=Aeromicrobium piscarium TaxID=2590901 RepID=A0A554RWD9_9ACTN|nr:ABC transporter permease [Aeromicrobium piscarium]TSD58414.1 ABC transporter permease [Aeromicrobium piscarium]
MLRFALRRLAGGALLLVIVSMVIFVLLRVLPGDPVLMRLGASTSAGTEEAVNQLRQELGLDAPLPIQYLDWMRGVLTGDLGVSYVSQFPVSTLIGQRIPATLQLAAAAIVLALVIAVPVALLGARWPGTIYDRLTSGGVTVAMAIPQFWLGLLLVSVFAVQLDWLPARGYVAFTEQPVEHLRLLLLPAVTLGVTLAAPIARFLRSSLADVSGNLYMRTAEGKGLMWGQAIVRHGLPNALMTTLTFVGLLAGQLLGGVVLVEYVFGWPGLGSLTVDAIAGRDYGILQGVILLLSAGFLVINLLIDLAYGLLNPRIRVGAS